MTRVTMKSTESEYFVSCEGHATGSPETCSAISTLIYTLLGYLKNSADVVIDIEEIADGYAEIIFSGGKCAEIAFEMIRIGFLQLAQAKSKFIEIF